MQTRKYIVNNSYTKVVGDTTGLQEFLTFTPHGFQSKETKEIMLFQDKKFPSGLVTRVLEEFPGEVVDNRVSPTLFPLRSQLNASLYPFQKEAVEVAINKARGILNLPVSSGKTYIAVEVFRQLGLKTLYLVPRNELMFQVANKFKELIKEPLDIGFCGDSFMQDGRIVVASIFSAKNLDLTKFGLVIADESHKTPAFTYFNTIMECTNAYYRLSLTGTVKGRYDQMEILGEACVGPIVYSVGWDTLKKHNLICDAKVIFLETITPKSVNLYAQPEYYKRKAMMKIENECIVKNNFRNTQIQQAAKMFNGSTVLIFVKRIEHGKILERMILNSVFCSGKMSVQDRVKVLTNVKEKTIISTSIFEEGIDTPFFDVIINAAGGKSVISLTQKIGRGLRNRDGKNLLVIDFLDIGNGFAENLSRARYNHLCKEGFDVSIKHLFNK